jgi:hypothetical protein
VVRRVFTYFCCSRVRRQILLALPALLLLVAWTTHTERQIDFQTNSQVRIAASGDLVLSWGRDNQLETFSGSLDEFRSYLRAFASKETRLPGVRCGTERLVAPMRGYPPGTLTHWTIAVDTRFLLALLLLPLLLDIILCIKHRPLPPGHCLNCGYDLRASAGHCPECGAPIPAKPRPI